MKNTELNHVFPDIHQWPETWAGDEYDIPVGEVILQTFKSFLLFQQARVSKRTLKDYADYLWNLGGEIIRDTNENAITVNELTPHFLLDYVNESGGPYWRHALNEKEHQRYHAICRKFYKYLIQIDKSTHEFR